MRTHLWFKLTAAFALIIFIGVVVTVWLTNQGAATQLEHFMVANQMVRPTVMQAMLADYFRERKSWADLDAAFDALALRASDGVMTGMFGSLMGMSHNRIQVLNARGQVVADSAGSAGDAPLTSTPLEHWPIVVEGALVGELVVEGSLMSAAAVEPTRLVSSVTRAVFFGAVIAAVAGLGLAALFVRQITRPLVDLTHASRRIAQGELDVRVPVISSDEVGELAQTFNQMAATLEKQEMLRRNLMADITHELRTPLTGIQGAVEAMQDGVFPADAENLEALHAEVLLLNRLVDDLRTLANAEAGQLVLEIAPVDLVESLPSPGGCYATARRRTRRHADVPRASPGADRGRWAAAEPGAAQPARQCLAPYACWRCSAGQPPHRRHWLLHHRHRQRPRHPARGPALRLRPLLSRRPLAHPDNRRLWAGACHRPPARHSAWRVHLGGQPPARRNAWRRVWRDAAARQD
jgi:signal transduction histidine kinase